MKNKSDTKSLKNSKLCVIILFVNNKDVYMKKIWNKNENKILIVLLFFSISIGLWNNFRQLWMQDNGP
jgi:hypothetical protein